MRVVAYCRVSTTSRDQANSFENQKTYFEREISKNPQYEFVGIYADKGITGTKLHRPEFDRMLFDAALDVVEVSNVDKDERKQYKKYVTIPSSSRQPLFDLILTKNTSRFARNVEVESILRDLARNKVYVHFLDLNKSTENKDDITYIQIFQSFDERESRDKSTKVSFGIQEGNRKGVVRTNSKIYGYYYIQSKNKLVVIPEEAEIIKLIFSKYEEGYGIRRIVNYLKDNDIKTRNGVYFCKSAIKRILTNEKYAGLNNQCKYDHGYVFNNHTYAKIRDNYKVESTDKIEPIISEESFYKCQDIMQSKINYINQKGIYNGISKYSRLFYCGKCGASYHRNVDRDRKFYECSNKKRNGLSACDNINVNETFIDNFFNGDTGEWFYKYYEQQKHVGIQQLYNAILQLDLLFDKSHTDEDNQIIYTINDLSDQLERYRELYVMSKTKQSSLLEKIEQLETKILEQKVHYNSSTKSNYDIAISILDLYNRSVGLSKASIEGNYTKEDIIKKCHKIFIRNNNGKPDFVFCIKEIDDIFELTKQFEPITDEKIITMEQIESITAKVNEIISNNQ